MAYVIGSGVVLGNRRFVFAVAGDNSVSVRVFDAAAPVTGSGELGTPINFKITGGGKVAATFPGLDGNHFAVNANNQIADG